MNHTANHTASRSLIAFAALAIAAVCSSAALAAPWGTPSGNQTDFTFSSGQTQTGKFGGGTSTGNGFFFTPAGFSASAAGSFDSIAPGSSSASDTLSVILNAKPTQQFSQISTSMLGDFSTTGFASVNAGGELRVFNLDTAAMFSTPLTVTGFSGAENFVMGNSQGEFNGLATLALPNGWTNVRVELDGIVTAGALFGSSTITAKDVSLDVETVPFQNVSEIPIPAALAVAPLGAAIAWRARRKLARR